MEEKIFYALEKERIDKYLSSIEEEYSRSFIQKLIKDQAVLVNKTPVKSSYILNPGDEILLIIPEPTMPIAIAEDIPLDILYEDKQIIIINKPKGMVVHPAAGHENGTLVNALLHHCKEELSGINGVLRPGIVHRIDRDTTGVLVICKTDEAHKILAGQLKEHSIHRVYHAVVHGILKEEEGTIDAPIGRSTSDRKKMAILPNGKHAVTHYKVLSYLKGYTYIKCQLETGRTHQIRVHMASKGHPLLGDIVYGPSKCPITGLIGQTLHAMTLGFLHPTTNKYIEFTAPLPEYFQKLLQVLQP